MGRYDDIDLSARIALLGLGGVRDEEPPSGAEGAPEAPPVDLGAYEGLAEYAAPCPVPTRPVKGREDELDQMACAMERPEVSNVVLLGRAGTGKSTIVYEASRRDPSHLWLEVDVARMCQGLSNPDAMGARLKGLFDDAARLAADGGRPVVLFIDEFHQLVSLSYGAVEALKPILARSNAVGVHVVAATTYEEWVEYVSPNQALVERLERVSVKEMDHGSVVAVVDGFLTRHLDGSVPVEPGFSEAVVAATDDYMPANAQPRKAIQVADACVGTHRRTGCAVDKALVALVMERLCGARIETAIDAVGIHRYLDSRVFSQEAATEAVASRLEISAAGFCDPGRPKASFLFCGSTGVGKTELAKALASSLFGSDGAMVRFDMSEYADESLADRFRQALCQEVWSRPFSVVLLDEIEKASGAAVRLLLQVLDDARLSDRNGRETSFSSTYVVVTTNAAADVFDDVGRYDSGGAGRLLQKLEPLIHDRLASFEGGRVFTPEFLGRIDCVVPFQPLSEETSMRVVEREVASVCEKAWRLHGVRVDVDPRLLDYFRSDLLNAAGGVRDSKAGGARRVKGLVGSRVAVPVAAFINANPKSLRCRVSVEGELLDEQDVLEKAKTHAVNIESMARVVVTDGSWR